MGKQQLRLHPSRLSQESSFGAAALALNLIPVVGLAFSFTTTVGAALWAADLEKKDGGSAAAEPEVNEVEM